MMDSTFLKILPLTIVISLRFFGLFIILPTISLHASSFHDASGLAIGLVIGLAYFTQFIFQTPFGALSDRFNRNYIIIFGLFIFLIGSIICGFATDIWHLILGRALQGAGAIGGIVSAKISDLSPESKRTKSMALMGAGIFLSFLGALVLGPIIVAHFGNQSLFFISAVLCVISIIIMFFVPHSPKLSFTSSNVKMSAINSNLMIMNLSSFLEKALMTLIFVMLPLLWVKHFNQNASNLWYIYLPAGVVGIFAMGPASIIAEKYNRPKAVLSFGIACFLVAFLLLGIANFISVFAGVIIFFIGFATLEPIMQSMVSKFAKAKIRGLALGNFTASAYLGSFVGGFFGSIFYHIFGLAVIGFIVAFICILWLIVIRFLDDLSLLKIIYIHTNKLKSPTSDLAILGHLGVKDWYINDNEQLLVIKFDPNIISQNNLESELESQNA